MKKYAFGWGLIDMVYSNSFKIRSTSLKLQGFNSTTSTSNVGGTILSVHFIQKSECDFDNGPSQGMLSWWLLLFPILFHTPSIVVIFFPTFATFYLFLPSSLFYKLCNKYFLHCILIFLLFFGLRLSQCLCVHHDTTDTFGCRCTPASWSTYVKGTIGLLGVGLWVIKTRPIFYYHRIGDQKNLLTNCAMTKTFSFAT